MNLIVVLREATELAHEAWKGCDWETRFGSRGLNLQSIRSRQAVLAAKAMRGTEADCWHEASAWLSFIEGQARNAANHADEALRSAETGDWDRARLGFEEAAKIAGQYEGMDPSDSVDHCLGISQPSVAGRCYQRCLLLCDEAMTNTNSRA